MPQVLGSPAARGKAASAIGFAAPGLKCHSPLARRKAGTLEPVATADYLSAWGLTVAPLTRSWAACCQRALLTGQYQTASLCLSLQSFAAIIHRHLTLEKASYQGKQALLDLAGQPGMQQVSCEGVQVLRRCDN